VYFILTNNENRILKAINNEGYEGYFSFKAIEKNNNIPQYYLPLFEKIILIFLLYSILPNN